MRLLYIIFILLGLISCHRQEEFNDVRNSGSYLYTQIEEVPSTKTGMNEANNVLWSERDELTVFNKSTLPQKYRIQDEFVGKNYGYFSPVETESAGDEIGSGMPLGHIIAYYPYADGIECHNSEGAYRLSGVMLPSEQTYAKDSFGQGTFPMVAVSQDNNITFRNVCGGIKLLLKGTQAVASIRIEGNDNEKLAGAATVTAYTDGSDPAIELSRNASTYATLTCSEAVQLNESTATGFIIALPPTEFSQGFTVTVTDSENNSYTIETYRSNEIIRSSLLVMPTVHIDEDSNESWTEYPFSHIGYIGPDGDIIGNPTTGTTDFLKISEASTIYYHGRMGPYKNYYSVGFYDADKNFLPDISICGTGKVVSYTIDLNDPKYDAAVYVRGSWSQGPDLTAEDTDEFLFAIKGAPQPPKKRFAVLCDSIGTHGNSGYYSNVAEIEITPADVGVELSAYLTYYDTHNAGEKGHPTGSAIDFVLGGNTYTEKDDGKLITFIPTIEDIGKKVGKVYNYNDNSLKTWWMWLAEAYDMEPIPVCWSSSSISSHETSTPRLKNSYSWHDSQITKCAYRTPGTMERTAPEYIIIARGTNDWSHGQGTIITDNFFENPQSWTCPTTDAVGNYFGIKEAISLTVTKMRAAYPDAKVVLCTMPYNNRGTNDIYNGKSWTDFNLAVKECAEFFDCAIIDFAECGMTSANLKTYAPDGTHFNYEGHKLAGQKAIEDLASMIN